jgi:small subunit ribosomal protein S21
LYCREGACEVEWTARKGVKGLATVTLRTGESQESLLKRFRKEVMKERILPTVRKKRWFTPPSELRRLKKQKAIRKARQAQRRREGRESIR